PWNLQYRLGEKIFRGIAFGKKRFDVSPQPGVVRTRLGEKGGTIGERPAFGGAIQLLDPFPAFRRHEIDRLAFRAAATLSRAASRPSPWPATLSTPARSP